MNTHREVVIVSGVRTAVGDFGGGLKDVAPTELGAQVVHEALARARVAGDEVGQVVFGNVIHTEPKDMYLARVAAMNAGVAKEAPALTLNRLCGSGLQAVVSAAQTIMLGDTDIAVAGGVENMSRSGYLAQGVRWGWLGANPAAAASVAPNVLTAGREPALTASTSGDPAGSGNGWSSGAESRSIPA